MSDLAWLGPVLGAAIAAAAGIYQWRKTDKQRRNSRFVTRRAEVMEKLVEQLQQVQILSREQAIDSTQLEVQTRGLNKFLIENRLWLEEADARLAREYLEALTTIHKAIQNGTPADFDLLIGTAPVQLYGPSVAHWLASLGRAEKELMARTRKALQK
jgi:hypothetical protein